MNLEAKFNEEGFGDVIINVGNRKFYCHRSILSMWSPVFSSMFNNGMKETCDSEVRIEEENPDEFQVFLRKIYPPCSLQIDNQNVSFLCRIADRYGVSELSNQCESFLLSDKRPCSLDTLLIAEKYGFKKLISKNVDWIANPSCSHLSREEVGFLSLSKKTLQSILRREVSLLRMGPYTGKHFLKIPVFCTGREESIGTLWIHKEESPRTLFKEAAGLILSSEREDSFDPPIHNFSELDCNTFPVIVAATDNKDSIFSNFEFRKIAKRRNGTLRPSCEGPFGESDADFSSVDKLPLGKGLYVRDERLTVRTEDVDLDPDAKAVMIRIVLWKNSQPQYFCDALASKDTTLIELRRCVCSFAGNNWDPNSTLMFDEETADHFKPLRVALDYQFDNEPKTDHDGDGGSDSDFGPLTVEGLALRTGDILHFEPRSPEHFLGTSSSRPISLAFRYYKTQSLKRRRSSDAKSEEDCLIRPKSSRMMTDGPL